MAGLIRFAARGRAPAGFALLVVLLLLAALALSAASTLRMGSAAQQAATGARMHALAWQAAEIALRHCEAFLVQPDALRPPAFQEAALPLGRTESPAWLAPEVWRAGLLPGPPWPGVGAGPAPVCLVERQALGSGQVHVVTARGFGPDWRGEAGATVSGSAVWLQSVVLVHAGVVRERVQRQLLVAPLR